LISSDLFLGKPYRVGLCSCLLLLSGCAVGSDYHPPVNSEVINEWDALHPDDDTIVASSGLTVSTEAFPSPWWQQFGDETLFALMKKALNDNHDLKIAKARIAEARASENFTESGLLPEIDATGSLSRASLDAISSSRPDTIRQAGVSGNWDIDPFGGNRRRNEGAVASVEASEYDFAQARLNVLADVAINYSHLRAAQKQLALTLQNLKTQRDTLRVTQALRKAQNVTELDIARVEAQIAATEARLPQIRTTLYAAIYRLGVLAGEPPATFRERLMPEEPMLALPKNVAVQTPIATLAQRPDVKAAERRLAEASALSNAAFAGLFPKLSLSAFFGTRHSATFGSLSPWSATAEALFPLLDFGRLRAQMHGADARQEQAFHAYKQTVLKALEETENSLNAYMDERRRSLLLHNVAVGQARAVTIAREQYRGGIVTQLDLLDAERNQLDAETNWVLSQQTATDNLIQLFHSLGGEP
jgi:NodT family efflux transporter outer membrane factor (OMF) lipoprotein